MKKVVTCILLTIAAVAVSGCGKKGPNIEGKWAIDLEPMLKQAKESGINSQDTEKIRAAFSGTRLIIGSNSIRVSTDGKPNVETNGYRIISTDGECLVLDIGGKMPKYCIVGDRLKVRDPVSKIDAVYKRY